MAVRPLKRWDWRGTFCPLTPLSADGAMSLTGAKNGISRLNAPITASNVAG
jgi:hypothetical protein